MIRFDLTRNATGMIGVRLECSGKLYNTNIIQPLIITCRYVCLVSMYVFILAKFGSVRFQLDFQITLRQMFVYVKF